MRIEHGLSNWVSFLIVPLFALANAGVDLGVDLAALILTRSCSASCRPDRRQAGWYNGGVALVIRATGWLPCPAGVSWAHVYGAAWVCGIGFTMSLFMADLAYGSPDDLDVAKVGVLLASVAIAGRDGCSAGLPCARERYPTRWSRPASDDVAQPDVGGRDDQRDEDHHRAVTHELEEADRCPPRAARLATTTLADAPTMVRLPPRHAPSASDHHSGFSGRPLATSCSTTGIAVAVYGMLSTTADAIAENHSRADAGQPGIARRSPRPAAWPRPPTMPTCTIASTSTNRPTKKKSVDHSTSRNASCGSSRPTSMITVAPSSAMVAASRPSAEWKHEADDRQGRRR